jgi:hypothetical protein
LLLLPPPPVFFEAARPRLVAVGPRISGEPQQQQNGVERRSHVLLLLNEWRRPRIWRNEPLRPAKNRLRRLFTPP